MRALSPDLITDDDLARATGVRFGGFSIRSYSFQRFRPFEFRLEQVDRFPESLYLVPEPPIDVAERTILFLADGTLSRGEFVQWVKDHSKPE